MTTSLVWPLLTSLLSPAIPTAAADDSKPACLECHGDRSLSRSRPGGKKRSLWVRKADLARSAHKDLSCEDCHAGFTADNHAEGQRRNKPGQMAKACQGCHEPGKNLHGQMLRSGAATRCARCHGGHTIYKGAARRRGCLGCHDTRAGLRHSTPPHGPLGVDPAAFGRSVHKEIRCTQCHPGYSTTRHPAAPASAARRRAVQQTCARCHPREASLTAQSVHAHRGPHGTATRSGAGNRPPRTPPTCTSCHTAHAVRPAAQDRALGAAACRRCHASEYEQYAKSVHGAAVRGRGNPDLPTCTDCHAAHAVRNPGAGKWRAQMPALCGNCHANRARMARYGLSPHVVKSYLDDFHGVTLRFYARENRSLRKIAVCVDCHGTHDIQSTRRHGRAAVKQRLLTRCRACHPQATAAFPAAWVSHWIPSAKRAPLVYYIQWFYRILIPLMLIGLGLQVLLHLWRHLVRR